MYKNTISDSFACNVGVCQKENLSPLLFAIYLNNFERFVSENYKGLDILSHEALNYLSDDDVEMFLKLYVLLYADDTIVMAESPKELQDTLSCVYEYCKDWKLSVNTAKTKIIIFSKGKVCNTLVFVFGSEELEVVDNYTYLGIAVNYNGIFKIAIDRQITAARSSFCPSKEMHISKFIIRYVNRII